MYPIKGKDKIFMKLRLFQRADISKIRSKEAINF